MGKIRISALGTEDEEAKKQKAKIRREEKKKRETHISGMKGGEKIVDMSATEPEAIETVPEAESTEHKKKKAGTVRERSKNYQEAKKLVKNELYPLSDALDLLKKISLTKFDGSVEVHINTTEKGVRGQVNLPHGTGRQIRVAVADDALLDKVNSGKIDFDVLVSSPAMMPKLAKMAKILGPRGLMPNPKAGTISDKPEELAKKLSTGQTQYKTETEAPIIHMVIGKISFPNKDLEENLSALTTAIGPLKIKNIFIKSTMSPSIKVKI